LTIRLLLQPSVNGVAVSLLVSGLTVDILSTFCGVFMVQCVKLMLRIFEFGVLLKQITRKWYGTTFTMAD